MTDDNKELTEQTDAQVQETEDPSEKKERRMNTRKSVSCAAGRKAKRER